MIQFLGIQIRIQDLSGQGIEGLLQEAMRSFQSNDPVQESFEIQILKSIPAEFPFGLRKVFTFRKIKAYGFGPRRACLYPDGTWVYLNGSQIQVAADFERVYKTLQSVLGERLELRGYHRIHAVGFQESDQTTVICAAPGAGKSTMALQNLKQADFILLSEESPLIHSTGKILPFPLPIGILEGNEKKRHAWNLKPEAWRDAGKTQILFARKIRPHAKIQKISRLRGMLFLFPSVVAGLGLVQLTEILLRYTPTLNLDRILYRRLALWLKLSFSKKVRFGKLTD
ncbi:MAG: hypothetical protein JNL01_03365 [Bdellovibrionales bacterium]|nr:hypothetical protein [Bdellovibrionales bacterium]